MVTSGHDSSKPSGERLKASELAALESRNKRLLLLARRKLLQILLERLERGDATATMDDLRGCIQAPPGTNPKVFGSVPGELARAKIIADQGYRNSLRPEAHARPVHIWRLINPDAAKAWLQRNPTPPPAADPPLDSLFGELRDLRHF